MPKKNDGSDQISVQEWTDLFEAADNFKKQKSWEWIYDDQLIGIKDPVTGEIQYCCIMGNLGEFFALSVYQGAEGLYSYKQNYMHDPEDPSKIMFLQKCIMASFEDRAVLDKDDLKIIRELGLKYRGKNQWPQFRSYRPNYVPWDLEKEEVRILTLALQHIVEYAPELKSNPDVLEYPDESKELYLVRIQQSGEWNTQWLEPEEYVLPQVLQLIDQDKIERIKQLNLTQQGVILSVCIQVPSGIQDEGRPYFPYCILILSEGGLILGTAMCHPENFHSEYQNSFLKAIENIKMLPEMLLAGSPETMDVLAPIADQLNIKLHFDPENPELGEVLESMLDHFMQS